MLSIMVLALLPYAALSFLPRNNEQCQTKVHHHTGSTQHEEVDVVVIGSGIGGLSCASLASKYGLKTLCLEAHDTPGGCAHSFNRYSSASQTIPFQFDSGPSLITGCSSKSTNPLRQVLDAVGTSDDIEWKTYDGWVVHDYADGKSMKLTAGNGGEFERAIEEKAGTKSRKAFEKFKEEILRERGLAEVSAYIPPLALRGDLSAPISIFRYLFKLISIGAKGLLLTGPFSKVMDLYDVSFRETEFPSNLRFSCFLCLDDDITCDIKR